MPNPVKNKSTRILVSSDDAAEAKAVQTRLAQDFESVRIMVGDEVDAELYKTVAPEVLVLAIKSVTLAERFYLGLFRSGATSHASRCRTILLCSKEEVALAFDLCKRGYFDDYVLQWPLPYDGMRLTMSVWVACRDAAYAPRLEAPDTGELIAHVRSLDAIDATLETRFTAEHRALLEPHMAQARSLAVKVNRMRLHLMVVEDDLLSGQVIEHVLGDEAIDIELVKDAAAALASLRRQRPDLILMDVRLPGMDGVMLTQAIKALPGYSGVPIVMLTGSAKREIVAASMAAGATGFIVKPVTRESLMARIRPYMPLGATKSISCVT